MLFRSVNGINIAGMAPELSLLLCSVINTLVQCFMSHHIRLFILFWCKTRCCHGRLAFPWGTGKLWPFRSAWPRSSTKSIRSELAGCPSAIPGILRSSLGSCGWLHTYLRALSFSHIHHRPNAPPLCISTFQRFSPVSSAHTPHTCPSLPHTASYLCRTLPPLNMGRR